MLPQTCSLFIGTPNIKIIAAVLALPAVPLSGVEKTEWMEYSSSSSRSVKRLHSIYSSPIPSLFTLKMFQKELLG